MHDADDAKLNKRKGTRLPHWTRSDATYAVTFRLADSLPDSVLSAWLFERRDIHARADQIGRDLSSDERRRLLELHSEQIEAYLDAGHGACWLREPEVARIVANALGHFDGQRYRLHAWCVMPNHVHVILEPFARYELPAIMHSWKSFTAKAANVLLGRRGAFWQEEYYDHLVRDQDDYEHAMQYLLENPAAARPVNWPWVGTASIPPERAA